MLANVFMFDQSENRADTVPAMYEHGQMGEGREDGGAHADGEDGGCGGLTV